jgi:hypothetical protein
MMKNFRMSDLWVIVAVVLIVVTCATWAWYITRA